MHPLESLLQRVPLGRNALARLRREWTAHGPAVRRLLQHRRGLSWAFGVLERRGVGLVQGSTTASTPSTSRFRALLSQRHGISDLDAERDPLKRMYLDFALSTTTRGEAAARFVGQLTPIAGKRYLDVGCAYGGFLVAFKQAGAAEAVGIELNADLTDYARALLADHQLACSVHNLNLLDAQAMSRLGTFDVITCNDVIEHVDDPREALERLLALLSPGGVLYLEIPNRFSAPFIRSDGHYQLFGITALPKRLADAYFAERSAEKHQVLYKSLPWYLSNLRRLGGRPSVHHELPADLGPRLDTIAAVFAEVERLAEQGKLPLSEPMQAQVRRRTRALAAVFRRLQARWLSLAGPSPEAARRLGERMLVTFGMDFWRVTVQKPAQVEPRSDA